MLSLTYLSSAVDPFSKDELAGLLSHARAKNERLDVSGMMLYSGGNIIQTLEGPADTVDGLFTLIEADPRHHELFIAVREDIDERFFPDWTMGYREISPDTASAVPGFSDYLRTGEMPPSAGRNAAATFHRVFRDHIR